MERFELLRSSGARCYFTFRASDGEPVVDSMRYETELHAPDALDLLRRHAREAAIDDQTGTLPDACR